MSALGQLVAPIRKRPLVSATAGILVLLLGTLVAARLWIASEGGHGWLLSQIDGRKAGAYGTLEAEGLSGDPLGKLYLRRLAVRDAEGEWLVIQNISVDWAPLALISGLVDVKSLSAGQVDFIRRPVTVKQPPSNSSSDFRIKLRSLNIPDLAFEEGFAGPEAHFAVAGRYDQQGRSLAARLEATPRDTGNDQLLIDLSRATDGAFRLDTDINGAPDGIIANLIGLDTGTGVTLRASASGTPENASGEASLSLGDLPAATAQIKIHDNRLTANADVNAARLPMLGRQLTSLIGETATLRLESTTGRHDAPFGIVAALQAGSVSVRGTVDTKSWQLKDPASLEVQVSDIQPLLGEPGSLSFSGTATQDRKDWLLQGKAALGVSGEHALPFERVEGPVRVSVTQTDIAFSGDLTVAKPLASLGSAAGLFGDTSTLHTAGRFDRAGHALILDSAEASLANGTVSTAGTIDLAGKQLDLKGSLSTALDPLPGGARGRISGPFSVSGALSKPAIDLNLAASDLAGLPAPLLDATGRAPGLRAALQVVEGGLKIGSARLSGQRAVMTAAGTWAWSGNSDVRASLTQSQPVTVSGWSVTLGNAQFQIAGRAKARRFELTTAGGMASGSGREIDDLTLTASLREAGMLISGPVTLRANVDGEAFATDAQLERQSGETRLDAISGTLGPGTFSGAVLLTDKGDINGDFSVDGTALSWSGGQAREANGTLHFERADGDPFTLVADLAVTSLDLGPGRMVRFDRATASVRSAPQGYDIHANFASDDPIYATDLTLIASASLGAPAPSGMFELSGTAFGETVATATPAHWRLGDTPELDVDIAALSGRLKAGFTGGGDETHLVFDATGLDLSPVLALYVDGVNRTQLEGHGDLKVFGATPSGTIHMVAASDVPGLDSSMLMDLDGTLTATGLSVSLQSDYGGRLTLQGTATVPVMAEAGKLVAPDRTAPLSGEAVLKGDLAVLRTAALAYGHDVSGDINASAKLAGTLDAPEYSGAAHLDNGTYELGSLGFQLSAITLDAGYDGQTLNVDGKAGAPGGGTFALKGELAGDRTHLTADFKNLMLYNRDGDHARGTGSLVLADSRTDRSLSGKVLINQARFSLDNLPSARPRALDVRWTDDPPAEPGASRLRRTLALNIDIDADRRVYITGRGLDSEWQSDLKLTGTPAAPLLNGKTTLVRGDLDLAGRPFVFDTGTITFDGPVSRARIDVSAERTVNGFDVQVDVTGSPLRPVIELSSSPELPEDEILSRLLFGRSSMDLSALEAAQLATTIARLSGNSGGFDPASGVQSALGIDRFSIGTSESGGAEIGVGQYLTDDVYLELKSAGAEGSSVEVEWQPRPQVSVTSETHATGESKVSIRWKRDY